MPEAQRREIMMPVPQSDATAQFFIEAMKANTDVLKELRADMKEDRRLLNDVHVRIVRIESNRVDSRVAALETEVVMLKKDKTDREAVGRARDWLLKHSPTIVAFVVAIFGTIVLTLKATGRL
jgi:hypothetical protein